MDNEQLQDGTEEQEEHLILTDEDGNDTDFLYLDCLEYNGSEYLVLAPADEPEITIVILRVEQVDEETENYLPVMDEEELEAVYQIFKDLYKDILTFEDERDEQ
ncbi:MAG: DUF1292 domain-containing protein [Firmicutes bacterium]|nr:DUF1292 domain-containing protein [Bacillota bacterium]